jgi:hypothetical protein
MITLADRPALSPIHRAILDRVRAQPGRWNTARFAHSTEYTASSIYRAVCELRRWALLAPYDHTERPHGRWTLPK